MKVFSINFGLSVFKDFSKLKSTGNYISELCKYGMWHFPGLRVVQDADKDISLFTTGTTQEEFEWGGLKSNAEAWANYGEGGPGGMLPRENLDFNFS